VTAPERVNPPQETSRQPLLVERLEQVVERVGIEGLQRELVEGA
jgi:hypothetical protein